MGDNQHFIDMLDTKINFWISLYLQAIDEPENEIATQCLGLLHAKIWAEEKNYQKVAPEFRWTDRAQEIIEQRVREQMRAHKTRRIIRVSVVLHTANKHPFVSIRRFDENEPFRHRTARYEIRDERRAHRIQKLFANREVATVVFADEVLIKFNVEV